jgi:hypothetical protein
MIADANLDPLPEVGHLEPSGREQASFARTMPPRLVAGVCLFPLFVDVERGSERTLGEATPA